MTVIRVDVVIDDVMAGLVSVIVSFGLFLFTGFVPRSLLSDTDLELNDTNSGGINTIKNPRQLSDEPRKTLIWRCVLMCEAVWISG